MKAKRRMTPAVQKNNTDQQPRRTPPSKSRKSIAGHVALPQTAQVEQAEAELVCSRRSEDLLRESGARYRSLVENAQDVIFALANDGTIISLNAAFERFSGWSRAEWIGRSYKGLVHSADRRVTAGILRQIMTSGGPLQVELRIKTPIAESRIWELKIVREEMAPHLILGIARDITERKKHDEERALLATAVQAAGEAVVVTDAEGFIRYVNPAFEQVTGWLREEVTGETIHLLNSGEQDDAFFQSLRDTLHRDHIWRGRLVQKKKDGSLYDEDCTISRVYDRSGRLLHHVFVKRDVTERLKLESIAESVSAMDNAGYILSGVRHEIGNPINSVKTILSVLRQKLGMIPEQKVREYVDSTLSELGRAEYLLRILKGRNLYENQEITDVDMAEFVKRLQSLVFEDFRRKNIALTVDIDKGSVRASADERQLHQVMLNILTNAADAVEGRAAPAISVRVEKEPRQVRITVSDNGCGMTDEQQRNLFKPFCSTKSHGTGLGLVLVRKMLTQMSGEIAITSAFGGGTTVEIFVPSRSGTS